MYLYAVVRLSHLLVILLCLESSAYAVWVPNAPPVRTATGTDGRITLSSKSCAVLFRQVMALQDLRKITGNEPLDTLPVCHVNRRSRRQELTLDLRWLRGWPRNQGETTTTCKRLPSSQHPHTGDLIRHPGKSGYSIYLTDVFRIQDSRLEPRARSEQRYYRCKVGRARITASDPADFQLD